MWAQFKRRVGPANSGLIAGLLAIYVAQLVLLRTPAAEFVSGLYLVPFDVFRHGAIWQPFTYMWLHSPADPLHLVLNLLFIFMFGPQLEALWGSKRYLRAYMIFGLTGGLFTLVWGLWGYLGLLGPASEMAAMVPHVGASGATMGVAIAWGLVHANMPVRLLLIGETRGITLVWLLLGFEALRALSLGGGTSVSSHLGGITAAFVLCRGLWRPSRWRELWRRSQLRRKRRSVERDLRVIRGGSPDRDPRDPKNWN